MKVAGFTFIRNAVQYDYPVVEAINSILPICDEFVVALGNSEDATEALLLSIGSPKIKIVHTVWDDSLREGGKVLAVETDKAFAAISPDADWCFYIQGDEVVHEQYLPVIKEAMERYLNDKRLDGLILRYLHFYGSYQYVADSPRWYRKEVRIVRRNPAIHSYKDAQGFRKNGMKLRVKPVNAWMYHYGWVKNPKHQALKSKNFNRYWHNDQWIENQESDIELFDYSNVDSLKRFTGTHPEVMEKRVVSQNWQFKFNTNTKRLSLKNRFLVFVERWTGWRIGEYKNYKII